MSRTEIWEWVIILWAALSLMPFAFHYRPGWYLGYLAIVLVAMLWIFVQRFRRLK